MSSVNDRINELAFVAAARRPLGEDESAEAFVHYAEERGVSHYQNTNERLNIDFGVEKVRFPGLQTMDPRIVRIPPGKNNEYHRHAHESIFVVLSGEGEVRVGSHRNRVRRGDVAFVPRWLFHQSFNTSSAEELVLLAITDFGFTSAVLGDYDKRTRLSSNGADAATAAVDATQDAA